MTVVDNFWSDKTLDALAECKSPDALHWAVTGYRAGLEDGDWGDGYRAHERDQAKDWALVVADVQRRAGQPSHDELSSRREIDLEALQPCPQKCKTCASCWAFEQWWRRGRRPYLGVEQEARLARGAA